MDKINRDSVWQYAWLISGGILMIIYNGNAVSIAAWLAPLFVLRFTRISRGRELLFVPLMLAISHALLLYEPFSNAAIPPVFRIIFGMVCGLLIVLPLFVDRLLTRKIKGFSSTLIFPAAWVAMEYLVSRISPLSTFGMIGYTQSGSLPLVQIVSITGIWGLSFLVIWFSSVINWAWEQEFRFEMVKKGLAVYVAINLAIIFYGEFRLNKHYTGKMIRIAASSSSYDVIGRFREAIKNGTYPPLNVNIRTFDDFIAKAALPGSRVVFWEEYALITSEADEGQIIEHARIKAMEKRILLGLPMGVLKNRGSKHLLENQVVWIAPDGKILTKYRKSFTAPWETSTNLNKEVSIFKTEFGIIGTVICFDMDFPSLIRQAGKNHVELMLVPSHDWRGIAPFHSHMAVFRAIENGFSLVRPAGESGVSISSDPYGRVLSCLDNPYSQDKIMMVDVPIHHVKTIYSTIGDLFAWLTIAGLVMVSFFRNKG
jgi:apolipoprotein N-acyltransferase